MDDKQLAVESLMLDKEIARDILLKMLDQQAVSYEEFPDVKHPIELTCAAYNKILTAVKEG